MTFDLNQIKPYKKNAKKHDEAQIKNVMQSIKEFGIVQPIVVDRDNVIIIGHCRYEALKKLGVKTLTDKELIVLDVDEKEAERLRLLDNKLNESEWDIEMLKELVPDFDFSEYEIDFNLPQEINEEDLNDFFEEAPPKKDKEPKKVQCPHCGEWFEI